jgi:DNA-binding transcriptional MerR regulator
MPTTTSAAAYTVSQLAAEAAVPVARIKFYLREGLLRGGDLRAKGRAYYDADHVRRLRLIQVLRGVADLPVPAIGALCALLDRSGDADLAGVIAHVIDALGTRETRDRPAGAEIRARRELLALFAERGLQVRPRARAVTDLARALVGLRSVIDPGLPVTALEPYLTAMCQLAERDFAATAPLIRSGPGAALAATLGTVMWEPVLLLLRRLAHEHVATQRLGSKRSRR